MLTVVAVLSLALAACGGGEETEGPEGQETTTEQTTTDSPAETEADTGTEEAQGDAADVQASFPQEPAKVTYEMTGDAASDIGEMTLSWDPPRFAMLFEGGKMIFDEESMIFCDPSGEGCFSMPSQAGAGQMGAGLGPFLGFTNALAEGRELPDATTTGETEIAGRTATCATFNASAYAPTMQGEAEYCYDADTELMLRWSGTDAEGNNQTLEAVEVGEPEESDFEPTGPVQEMPQGGGGG